MTAVQSLTCQTRDMAQQKHLGTAGLQQDVMAGDSPNALPRGRICSYMIGVAPFNTDRSPLCKKPNSCSHGSLKGLVQQLRTSKIVQLWSKATAHDEIRCNAQLKYCECRRNFVSSGGS